MRLAVLILLLALSLPAFGRQDDDWGDDDWSDERDAPVDVHGLAELGVGRRVVGDPAQPDAMLMSEARFRLDLARLTDRLELTFKGDLVGDAVLEDVDLDIREALVSLRPSSAVVLKGGRQVMTWGTGDLVFLNDLFPKDFAAFFIGRDDEFLKAPANAIRATIYHETINVDIAWLPRFAPDRFITGERLSFFDPLRGRRVGLEAPGIPIEPVRPETNLGNSEAAVRLYRTVGGYEGALYGYRGFTKQPTAYDPVENAPTFSPLSVYGASLRGALAEGIGNVEVAYYDARDDRAGDDPFVPNGQVRALVGHERELAANLTLGLQYVVERTLDHDALLATTPTPAYAPSQTRHLVTSRWTYHARQQTLTLSLFTFWSPNDGDAHLRPLVQRQWSDALSFALGAHVFLGDAPTFFGQLADNTGLYARARYSF